MAEEVVAPQDTAPVEEAPVVESSTPKRDAWAAAIRAKNPDLAEDDEEGLYDAAMRGYDTEHDYAKQQRGDVGRMAEIMKKNPKLAAVFAEIYERGEDGNPEIALRNLDPDLKALINEQLTDEEYAKRKEDAAKAEEEMNAKMSAQEDVFRKVCEEQGLDYEETMSRLGEMLLKPMGEYGLGEKEVKYLINMLNYDEDVERARVQGKNEQIEARKKSLAKQSDGLPSGASAAAHAAPVRESALSNIASRRAAAKDL